MGQEGRTAKAFVRVTAIEAKALTEQFGSPGKGLRWLLDLWRQGEPMPQGYGAHPMLDDEAGPPMLDDIHLTAALASGAIPIEDVKDAVVAEVLDRVAQSLPPVQEEADYLTDEAPTLGTSVETIVPTSEGPLAGTIAAGIDLPADDLADYAPLVPAHRHKRGPLLRTEGRQGSYVRVYGCVIEGCAKELS